MFNRSTDLMPKPLLLIIAFLQGLALLAIYRALDSHYWPWQKPLFLYPILCVALVTPTLCLLSFTAGKILHYLKWIGIFTLTIVLAATYTGWQLEPGNKIAEGSIAFIFITTTLIACFKALMYIQQRGSGEAISYSQLFKFSWRNFLVLGFSLLFTLIFWGILFLCASLFKVIKINFIFDLIKHDWFFIPVLTLANGFGILIFRSLATAIDTIAKILQMLMKFLLPLLIGVAVAFLLALPFTGLQTLWGTGHGSLLILWLQLLILFFTNAVYQDESHILPYPKIIHRAIYVGIALLPIYSLIAFVGLNARISQYGFSVERCWAITLWSLLLLFAVGYCIGIIQKRDQWVEKLSIVNIRMGLVVLVVMILANTPLLDFRKVSLASQLNRFEHGKTTTENFDARYISLHLGRPGYLALEDFKKKYAESNPSFVKRIEAARFYGRDRDSDSAKPTQEDFINKLIKSPSDSIPPQELLIAIYEGNTQGEWAWRNLEKLYLIKCDLNKDGADEYLFINDRTDWGDADLWYLKDKTWVMLNTKNDGHWENQDLKNAIKEQNIKIIPPEWQRIKIGVMTFTVDDR